MASPFNPDSKYYTLLFVFLPLSAPDPDPDPDPNPSPDSLGITNLFLKKIQTREL